MVNILVRLTGVVNVAITFDVAISATQNGTYQTVSTVSLTLGALGTGVGDSATGGLFVPPGWWIKITPTATALGTTTLSTLVNATTLTRVVWNI